MIKLLVVTHFNIYEVVCSTDKEAYEYMNNVMLSGNYAFWLDFNFPSLNFVYHQVKQRLNKIRAWQEAYSKNDVIGILEGKNMLSKLWKLQGIMPDRELEKIAEFDSMVLVCS